MQASSAPGEVVYDTGSMLDDLRISGQGFRLCPGDPSSGWSVKLNDRSAAFRRIQHLVGIAFDLIGRHGNAVGVWVATIAAGALRFYVKARARDGDAHRCARPADAPHAPLTTGENVYSVSCDWRRGRDSNPR